jgi:hypothetical protein
MSAYDLDSVERATNRRVLAPQDAKFLSPALRFVHQLGLEWPGSGLARRAFSMPRLPSSTQLSISAGVRSNARLASATVVLPWMISSTKADFRRAVQRLISSSITTLIGLSLGKYLLSRISMGQYRPANRRPVRHHAE